MKESEKEPRTPARIKVMRQETAEGIESIPVSPQVQEPPTSGEITPRDHPLQSSQISELTSEAVTRAGGLDDFRAYEEQDTVVTESLRSGSVTSIEGKIKIVSILLSPLCVDNFPGLNVNVIREKECLLVRNFCSHSHHNPISNIPNVIISSPSKKKKKFLLHS